MGEWLIFIHADSRLRKGWLKKVKLVIKENENYIYFFKFKINNKKIIYRFLEIAVNLRNLIFKSPYGDQGLIIRKSTYFKNKGYRKIPLMEDIDFIKRLKNNVNLKMLSIPIYTSSRKWEKTNIFSQAYKNWNFRQRWFKGDSAGYLYDEYYFKEN